MGKKVLILSASPRKGGNSDTLCDQFLRGAKESGHQAEKVFLRDKKIGYCTGCGVCNKTHQCAQDDDMAEVLEKMVRADVIVMATPVYFYTMNAQMKTVIDRVAPRYSEVSDKEFYYLLTAADSDPKMLERTLECFRGFTEDCLTNPQERGVVYGVGLWEIGDVQKSPALKQAYEMGKGV